MDTKTIIPQLLTVAEFARYCNVCENTVWNWLARGAIRAWKPPAGQRFRHRRIHRRELDRVLSRQE